LRRRRGELRLTLQQVSDRMADKGERIPPSTLARVEQGKLDPGVRRLHLLLRLYDLPPHLVSDLVELEARAVEPPVADDLETLYRQGVEHWKRGDLGEGLAHLMAVREHVPTDEASRLLRQKATVAFAITAASLGKQKLAKQLADDLLLEPPDPSILTKVLVLAAVVWSSLGSQEAALAFIGQATVRLDPDDPQEAAWVLHQQAKILLDMRREKDADKVLQKALGHYRKLEDSYGEARALILRTRVLEALGKNEEALACIRRVIDSAKAHDHAKLAVSGSLELGRLLIRTGKPQDGLEAVNKGLSGAVLHEDKNAQFFAHYYLWKAHQALGDRERGRFELEAARYFVRFTDEASPEAKELRSLVTARGD
jgi:tetratricopeptide (TPR) repeat protein